MPQTPPQAVPAPHLERLQRYAAGDPDAQVRGSMSSPIRPPRLRPSHRQGKLRTSEESGSSAPLDGFKLPLRSSSFRAQASGEISPRSSTPCLAPRALDATPKPPTLLAGPSIRHTYAMAPESPLSSKYDASVPPAITVEDPRAAFDTAPYAHYPPRILARDTAGRVDFIKAQLASAGEMAYTLGGFLFRDDQRHNLWLTMSIVGRVLYGFGPVLIVQRFETMGPHGRGAQTGHQPTDGAGQAGGPGGASAAPAYTPLGIAWPAALSVIGAGLGFAASIGNWNDGKKINRFVAKRNWSLHNIGILLQLASHFITPLALNQLQGSNRLAAYLPQAVSAACLWNTIPASYSASASTRTMRLSDAAVIRRMEMCHWMRSVGGLFIILGFGSYQVQMHPLAVETFNIVGVLAVLLSFSMLMIPLRVITNTPRVMVEETPEQLQWRHFIALGGLGVVGSMASAMPYQGAGHAPLSASAPEAHGNEEPGYSAEMVPTEVEMVRVMTI